MLAKDRKKMHQSSTIGYLESRNKMFQKQQQQQQQQSAQLLFSQAPINNFPQRSSSKKNALQNLFSQPPKSPASTAPSQQSHASHLSDVHNDQESEVASSFVFSENEQECAATLSHAGKPSIPPRLNSMSSVSQSSNSSFTQKSYATTLPQDQELIQSLCETEVKHRQPAISVVLPP
jgi:hypothetical protein